MTHGGGELSLKIADPHLLSDRQCLEDFEQKDDSINQSMSDKGIYRTTPAAHCVHRVCLYTIRTQPITLDI